MNRSNVLVVIFDLHTITADERREYRSFRKYLISNGFSFVQESVYVKLIKNTESTFREVNLISYEAPKEGNVIVIPMSLNDFKNIHFIRGDEFDFSGFCDSVVVY